jgi:hypothetical protein
VSSRWAWPGLAAWRAVTASDPARWSEFALGQLGASAALLGLVFVGLSINLRELITIARPYTLFTHGSSGHERRRLGDGLLTA